MVLLKRLSILLFVMGIALCGFCQTAETTPWQAPKARHYYLDDIASFTPTVMTPVLGLCGVPPKYSWRERFAVTVTSFAICEGTVFALKHIVHSRRPDGTDRHSFPSGHTARAFRGAEVIREDFGWWWGAGAYAVAAATGALRIHHHRHRFGDVAAGAVIGFGSARLAYLLLPLERKLFGWDKTKNVTAVAAPGYDASNRALTLTAAVSF